MKDFIKQNKHRLIEMYATNEDGFADDMDLILQVLIQGKAIDKNTFCEIGLSNVKEIVSDEEIRRRIFNATNPYNLMN